MAASTFGRRGALLLLGGGLLAGCGGGLWPFGGGIGARQQPVAAAPAGSTVVAVIGGAPVAADGTALMPVVRLVAAERGRQGVILRAEAVAPMQGFHSPELRPVGRGADGIEVVELRAQPPLDPEPVGAEPTRILSPARFYNNREMRDIRGFRVVAAQNIATAPAP
jgi:hypothetical protein